MTLHLRVAAILAVFSPARPSVYGPPTRPQRQTPNPTRPTPSPHSSTGISPPTGLPAVSSLPHPLKMANGFAAFTSTSTGPPRTRAAETREFIDDPSPDKRKVLVDRLMSMPGFAGHFASVARDAWLPQTLTNFQFANAGFQFENWLRIRLP